MQNMPLAQAEYEYVATKTVAFDAGVGCRTEALLPPAWQSVLRRSCFRRAGNLLATRALLVSVITLGWTVSKEARMANHAVGLTA
jgi:hypothetical protein